jgi:PTS system nitrogen regulatory IIA component
MPHRVLTLDQVAEYLHLPRADVEQLVKRDEIPFHRSGDRLSFRKIDIDVWASRRLIGFDAGQIKKLHRQTTAKHHDISPDRAILPELLPAAHIRPALTARTKPSVIRAMIELADETGLLIHREDLLASVTERERLASTALPGGLAILHPTHHDPYMFSDSFVALGRTVQEVPFGSPDGQTTRLFFLVCCQDDRIHLHVLSRLSMICLHTSLLLDLPEAPDAEAMQTALLQAEQEVLREMGP